MISEFHDASAHASAQSLWCACYYKDPLCKNPLLKDISVKLETSVWQMTVICLYLFLLNLTPQLYISTFCVGP